MTQTIKIAVTLLVVAALAMSGVALAQSSDDSAGPEVEDTRAYAGTLERLEPLVEDGTLTESQAEAVASHLAPSIKHRCVRPVFRVIGAALDFLGITPQELREALAEDSTLAELAEANGSSGDELVAFLVGEIEERLDLAVENGRITEEEKDEHLANAEEKVTDLVNGDIDFPRPRRGPGFGSFSGEPPFDAGDASA